MKTTDKIDAARIDLLLGELRLSGVKLVWTALAATADKEGWPAARFLAALAEQEMVERGLRRFERHLGEARLPPGKTLDAFDFDAVPMISKAQVQALALIAIEKASGRLETPALVIAPTSLMANWRLEAEKFAPDLSVLVLQGNDRKKRFGEINGVDIVLTTYPLISRDHETLGARDWSLLLLDEAQTIKNPNAATTKLIRSLQARTRFCLTGTPLENHLGELWSIFSFALPSFLSDPASFTHAFRTPIEKKGDSERGRLLSKRIKPFLLRRTKEQVANELPPKTEIVERVEMEPAQRDIYRVHPTFDA